MNKFLCRTFVLALSFFAVLSFAEEVRFDGDIAKARLVLGYADRVDVSIETTEPPNNYAYVKAYTWGGDEASPPKKIVKSITIFRNEQSVFIPLSAYADLGSPRKISLQKLSASGFRLIISGGDAAGAYSATLDFKRNEITRRKVISGEFPKEVWEQTTFSFNHLNN